VNSNPAAVATHNREPPDAALDAARFRAAGYRVFETSAKTGIGVAEFAGALSGHTAVVTGPSGAGKSSLLNAVQPGLGLRVGEISRKVRRGTNTTVAAGMIPLERGGYLVDTPGFSEVGLWGVEPRELASCFPEMRPFIGECRFGDCRHLSEPKCAVRAAVERGEIAPDRHQSYVVLLGELDAEPKAWE
jgi:ribosome biogenesis GTPase